MCKFEFKCCISLEDCGKAIAIVHAIISFFALLIAVMIMDFMFGTDAKDNNSAFLEFVGHADELSDKGPLHLALLVFIIVISLVTFVGSLLFIGGIYRRMESTILFFLFLMITILAFDIFLFAYFTWNHGDNKSSAYYYSGIALIVVEMFLRIYSILISILLYIKIKRHNIAHKESEEMHRALDQPLVEEN